MGFSFTPKFTVYKKNSMKVLFREPLAFGVGVLSMFLMSSYNQWYERKLYIQRWKLLRPPL